MLFIGTIVPFEAFCADLNNPEIQRLIAEKQQKIATLEKCSKKVKGFKIAGISTIGLTAVGIAGNAVLAAQKSKVSGKLDDAKESLNKQQLLNVNSNNKQQESQKSDESADVVTAKVESETAQHDNTREAPGDSETPDFPNVTVSSVTDKKFNSQSKPYIPYDELYSKPDVTPDESGLLSVGDYEKVALYQSEQHRIESNARPGNPAEHIPMLATANQMFTNAEKMKQDSENQGIKLAVPIMGTETGNITQDGVETAVKQSKEYEQELKKQSEQQRQAEKDAAKQERREQRQTNKEQRQQQREQRKESKQQENTKPSNSYDSEKYPKPDVTPDENGLMSVGDYEKLNRYQEREYKINNAKPNNPAAHIPGLNILPQNSNNLTVNAPLAIPVAGVETVNTTQEKIDNAINAASESQQVQPKQQQAADEIDVYNPLEVLSYK